MEVVSVAVAAEDPTEAEQVLSIQAEQQWRGGAMDEAAARAVATSEGLTLVPFPGTKTGWKGVSPEAYGRFKVNALRGPSYDSVWSAALAYARHLGPAASAAAAASAEKDSAKYLNIWEKREAHTMPPRKALSAEEALAAAKKEGLTLEESEMSNVTKVASAPGATKYVGVSLGSAKDLPFRAKIKLPGVGLRTIGSYATAEEAALALARIRRKHGLEHRLPGGHFCSKAEAEAWRAPLTADQAHAAAEAEGLVLQKSTRLQGPNASVTGFKGVSSLEKLMLSRGSDASRPFRAEHARGMYATAEEAALAEARALALAADERCEDE